MKKMEPPGKCLWLDTATRESLWIPLTLDPSPVWGEGTANVSTTLAVYAHTTAGQHEQAAAILGEVLGGR